MKEESCNPNRVLAKDRRNYNNNPEKYYFFIAWQRAIVYGAPILSLDILPALTSATLPASYFISASLVTASLIKPTM